MTKNHQKLRHVSFFIYLILSLLVCLSQPAWAEDTIPAINGFSSSIKGEHFLYHSPHPLAKSSLLVRSLDSEKYIEWQTEKIPLSYNKNQLVFAWMFGIDVNEDSHPFDLTALLSTNRIFLPAVHASGGSCMASWSVIIPTLAALGMEIIIHIPRYMPFQC